MPSPTHPSRVDPRLVRTRAAVLASALDVLRREGIGGTTMDAIANVAGVARSTLYRNWSSRDELLGEAIDSAALPPSLAASTGSAIDQLTDLAVQLAHHLTASEWGRALPAIVAAADSVPELADRYAAFTDARRQAALTLARRAVREGALAADVDPGEFVDALVGALFYRRLVRRVPTSRAHARRIVARTIAAYAPVRE